MRKSGYLARDSFNTHTLIINVLSDIRLPITLYILNVQCSTYKYLAWLNARSTDQRIYTNIIVIMRAYSTLEFR